MKPSISNNQVYGFLPTDIDGVDMLAKLALDLRWSWNHSVDEIWHRLDPDLWMETHNPWVVLQTVSRDQLEKQMADQTVPNLASFQTIKIKIWDRTTARMARIGQVSFFIKYKMADVIKSKPVKSQNNPIGFEISLLIWTKFPKSKALAKPI